MGELKKCFVSWDDIQTHMIQLALRIAPYRKWKKIVCITRGGLIPGAVLSHILNIKDIDTLCLSSYDDLGLAKGSIKVIKELHSLDKDIILVDDLVDTGSTFDKAAQMLPNSHKVCIYAKPHGLKFVDSYFKEVSQNSWIVFPWENFDTSAFMAHN